MKCMLHKAVSPRTLGLFPLLLANFLCSCGTDPSNDTSPYTPQDTGTLTIEQCALTPDQPGCDELLREHGIASPAGCVLPKKEN